jgi:hypothetical protein
MKKPLTTLRDLTAARQNPREITVQNLAHLKHSIKKFGDISGIVFNRRSGELISGHQRVFALTEEFGDLQIVKGRIIVPTGESFAVRIVDWSEEDQLAASIAANSPTNQGTFTGELRSILASIATSIPNVYEELGFADLQPAAIHAPNSWSETDSSEDRGSEDGSTDSTKWKDTPEAREGKELSEFIAKDVKLEARFELKAPEKHAKKANALLLGLVQQIPGSSLRRLD